MCSHQHLLSIGRQAVHNSVDCLTLNLNLNLTFWLLLDLKPVPRLDTALDPHPVARAGDDSQTGQALLALRHRSLEVNVVLKSKQSLHFGLDLVLVHLALLHSLNQVGCFVVGGLYLVLHLLHVVAHFNNHRFHLALAQLQTVNFICGERSEAHFQ